jgi:hypothetical protein
MDFREYNKVLGDNPLLWRRPDFIENETQNTRDFVFDSSGDSDHLIITEEGEILTQTHLFVSKHESTYFEAYVGIDEIDIVAEKTNQLILEEEYKD